MIWLKRFIFTIWLSKRGGTFQRSFFRKMNSLKIKHLKKIHFLVFEYGNLTSVKTHRDRLENSGKAFWNEEFKFLVLERVKDLIKASDAVRSLPFPSSVCFAHETSEIFLFLL